MTVGLAIVATLVVVIRAELHIEAPTPLLVGVIVLGIVIPRLQMVVICVLGLLGGLVLLLSGMIYAPFDRGKFLTEALAKVISLINDGALPAWAFATAPAAPAAASTPAPASASVPAPAPATAPVLLSPSATAPATPLPTLVSRRSRPTRPPQPRGYPPPPLLPVVVLRPKISSQPHLTRRIFCRAQFSLPVVRANPSTTTHSKTWPKVDPRDRPMSSIENEGASMPSRNQS